MCVALCVSLLPSLRLGLAIWFSWPVLAVPIHLRSPQLLGLRVLGLAFV
jgi:hypothetical protein